MSITETIMVEPTTVQTRTFQRFFHSTEFDDDQGLVMLLDSKMEKRNNKQINHFGNPILRTPIQQLCGQNTSSLVLSTSLLESTQNYYVKTLHKINVLVQEKAIRIIPFFLYVSLFVLAVQALTVIIIIAKSPLTLGTWFLLSCGSILGFLFCYTSQNGLSQQITPPPTPSHSSASLHSLSS